MKNKILHIIIKVFLVLCMLLGLALAAYSILDILPVIARRFAEEGKPPVWSYLAAALGMLCILGAEYIAITLLRMMRTLNRDPFVTENVRALRRMGVAALIIMALGLGTLLLHPAPLAVIAALPIGLCGLFSLTLSGVFEQAVAFKQENDLTV